MKQQLRASVGLLAMALAAPVKATTIVNYLQPLHYMVPRNCCPSRYAAISAWNQHRRCGPRLMQRGGMSGGGGSGGGGAFQVTGVPTTSFSVPGSAGGGGGPPPLVPGVPPPDLSIPAPTIGEGVGGLISLIALVALARRRTFREKSKASINIFG